MCEARPHRLPEVLIERHVSRLFGRPLNAYISSSRPPLPTKMPFGVIRKALFGVSRMIECGRLFFGTRPDPVRTIALLTGIARRPRACLVPDEA